MATLNLAVSEEMNALIEAERAQEGYATTEDYLRALIREAQIRRAKLELETKLLEGLQGPAVEMTSEDWDAIEREAWERVAHERATS